MFSVLLVAVSSLVMLGTRAQLSWGESLQPYKEIQRALNSLERDLESAQPLFGIPVLLGPEGSSLEFARIGVGASEAEGWVRVVYRFEPAEESVSLIREVFPWEQGPSPAPQREEHLATLGDGKFSVGKVNEQTQELIWDTSWDGEMYGVPKLVKVDCTFPSGANPGGISLSRVIRNPSGVFAIMETP